MTTIFESIKYLIINKFDKIIIIIRSSKRLAHEEYRVLVILHTGGGQNNGNILYELMNVWCPFYYFVHHL